MHTTPSVIPTQVGIHKPLRAFCGYSPFFKLANTPNLAPILLTRGIPPPYNI